MNTVGSSLSVPGLLLGRATSGQVRYLMIFLDSRISVLVRDQYDLGMLACIEKSYDSDIKVVQDERELKEIHDHMLEMKSDPHKCSKLLSTYCQQGKSVRDSPVMAIFGEVSELEELLGEFPEL